MTTALAAPIRDPFGLPPRRPLRDLSPGVIASVLLHVLGIALLIFLMREQKEPIPEFRLVPVTVLLGEGEENASGRTAQSGTAPVKSTAHREPSTPKPVRVRENAKPTPADPLAAQLRSLAQLRQSSNAAAVSSRSASAGENGTQESSGNYGVKDLIRAQVLRRWSLDLDLLGQSSFLVAIHVVLGRNGQVLKAEVVDHARFRTDKAFHEIALSAKNAVLLSSPLILPPGLVGEGTEVTLLLNPRDALH